MARLGAFLIIFGAASSLLSLINYELRLLFWIENWGPGVAWGIRGGLAAVGLALVLGALARRSSGAPAGATAPGQYVVPGQNGTGLVFTPSASGPPPSAIPLESWQAGAPSQPQPGAPPSWPAQPPPQQGPPPGWPQA